MTTPGRPPLALRQFVLKMHSRCDLACDHCYVYEHADQSWRGRPVVVSDDVLRATAERIAEHASAHRLDTVHVVLHGGEPLLAGRARLRRAAAELTGALRGVCALDLRIHTNAVTLDERFCDLFDEFGIKVGVSLDGDRAANDLHRRYRDGRSSHDKVVRAVGLLNEPRYRHLFAGLLCTIDVRNDPVAVYDALAALTPPRVDFLLPHATWDEPPPRPDDDAPQTAYARWLLAVYNRWTADGRPMDVRIFDSVLNTLRGGDSLTESLGLTPSDLAVIETDGTFEQADSLKTAYDGAPATGMDVRTHTLDEVAAHPGVVARQQGLDGLSGQCRSCPVVRSCGGGLYAHRYRTGSGFLNPSVYCTDLQRLITDIRDRAMSDPTDPLTPLTPLAPATAALPSDPRDLAPASDGSAVSPGRRPLTDEQFDELALGHGSAATVDLLAGHQLALGRELLALVRQQVPQDAVGEAAWELLADLDGRAPQSVDAVLAHPYHRSWALRALQGDAEAAAVAMCGMAETAAAAALRAGHPATVTVPVRGGVLRLPTLGTLHLHAPAGPPDGSTPNANAAHNETPISTVPHARSTSPAPGTPEPVTVRTDGDGFTVLARGRTYEVPWKGVADAGWRQRRSCETGGWPVSLEDTDPWRDCHGHPAHDRLAEGEAEAWQAGLAAAWRWIRRELPAYAPGIAAGLRVVTPLRPSGDGSDISSAARDAFGAVAVARPAGPELLALLLVHEFQHVKLGAVLDLVDLHDPSCERLFYAPWRPDPRPLEGLLQGTYAHLAVVDFWRARMRGTTGEQAREAEVHFARWHEQTSEAVATLASSGALTPLGERFVAGMGETLRTQSADGIAPEAREAARRAAAAHRAAWQAP